MPRGAQLRGDEKRQSLTVKLDPSLLNQIEMKMDQLGVSKTSVVENLLINGLGLQMSASITEKEDLANEHISNSNDNLDDPNIPTKGEQQIFEIGLADGREMGNKEGREELMQELASMDVTSTSNPNGSKESHEHDFKPWLKVCLPGICDKPNPDVVEGLKATTEVECKECYETLGQVQTAIALNACPNCGAEGDMLKLSEGALEADESV